MHGVLALLAQLDAALPPQSGVTELSAALLQLVVTLGLTLLCAQLYREYRKPFFAWWSLAWLLYVFRLVAIITFLTTHRWVALYWHQVFTGWTALAVLGTALVFLRGGAFPRWIFVAGAFPPLWSFIAIYELDTFLWAALPAVVFLSVATLATGAVFGRYARRVRSVGATVLAASFLLWGLHHLDYPFLRQRGAWVPWGYYLDIIFVLAVGVGILLLVADDLRRGLDAMTALSGELQGDGARERPALVAALLARPLSLPAVRGSALYSAARGAYEHGAGVCSAWPANPPAADERALLDTAIATGKATTHAAWTGPDEPARHRFAALLPIPVSEGGAHTHGWALVIVGDARTPFAALDDDFLAALGQQIGGALANATLTERLTQRTGELERLSARMLELHEEERRRLSRELHDETAQVLSALKMEIEMLRKIVAPSEQHRIGDALALVDAGIRSIRAVTNELRPALLDDLGLVPALRSLATEFAARTRVETRFTAPSDDRRPPPALNADAELALFRALQEGLANVARHAGASRVDVTLAVGDGRVELIITDDGVGIATDAERNGGAGIAGMRERVAPLGGTVRLESNAGRGTTLTITLKSALL